MTNYSRSLIVAEFHKSLVPGNSDNVARLKCYLFGSYNEDILSTVSISYEDYSTVTALVNELSDLISYIHQQGITKLIEAIAGFGNVANQSLKISKFPIFWDRYNAKTRTLAFPILNDYWNEDGTCISYDYNQQSWRSDSLDFSDRNDFQKLLPLRTVDELSLTDSRKFVVFVDKSCVYSELEHYEENKYFDRSLIDQLFADNSPLIQFI
ncbi:hypothetical protein [Photobacterium damselae]|uniref:hypothetical protein n=1 Tax=Photobacterium damselae TaxID=38293 RepID=UPI00406814C7